MENDPSGTLRDTIGHNSNWLVVLPQPSRGFTISEPPCTFKLKKFGGYSLHKVKGGRQLRQWRSSFWVWLTKSIGISRKLASVLCTRRKGNILRIFTNWESIIDSFLLYDIQCFKSQRIWRQCFRSYLGVASSNLDRTIKFYKNLRDILYHEIYDLRTEEEPKWLKFNFFVKLYSLVEKERTRDNLFKVSHLMSTRNLAPGGKFAMLQAKQKYMDTTTSPWDVSHTWLKRLKKAALYSFSIAKRLATKTNDLGAHLSLSQSASFATTQREGGKAYESLKD
jgi:hypothetical protein